MEPFIGQIMMFAGNFAPRGWALCDGQLLLISKNGPLFSILGTTYGGDGIQTFALPDLRGRVPMHFGTGPGLTPRTQGEVSGSESVTLTVNDLAQHNHGLSASESPANSIDPNDGVLAVVTSSDTSTRPPYVYSNAGVNRNMAFASIGPAGNNEPFSIMSPYLVINFGIALEGIFPSQS